MSLAVLYPALAAEWDQAANGDFRPDQVGPGSGKYAWWHCAAGHTWRAKNEPRALQGQCRKCSTARRASWYDPMSSSYRGRIGTWKPCFKMPNATAKGIEDEGGWLDPHTGLPFDAPIEPDELGGEES